MLLKHKAIGAITRAIALTVFSASSLVCAAANDEGLSLILASTSGHEFQWEVHRTYGPEQVRSIQTELEELNRKSLERMKNSTDPKIRAQAENMDVKTMGSAISEETCMVNLRMPGPGQFVLHEVSQSDGKPFNDRTWQAAGDGLYYLTNVPNQLIDIGSMSKDSPLSALGGIPLAYINEAISGKAFELVNDPAAVSGLWKGDKAHVPSIALKGRKYASHMIFIWLDKETKVPTEVRKVYSGKTTYVWKSASSKFAGRLWPVNIEQTFYDGVGEKVICTEKWSLQSLKTAAPEKIKDLPPLPDGYRLRDRTVNPPVVMAVDMLKRYGKKAVK